jgi:hypothetical protein
MTHFHYHPEYPARHRWAICPDSDTDCPMPPDATDNDNAPAHGIKRPLIVNGCPVSRCGDCATLWTDSYLTNVAPSGHDIYDRCPNCQETYDRLDRLDPEVKYQTVTD